MQRIGPLVGTGVDRNGPEGSRALDCIVFTTYAGRIVFGSIFCFHDHLCWPLFSRPASLPRWHGSESCIIRTSFELRCRGPETMSTLFPKLSLFSFIFFCFFYSPNCDITPRALSIPPTHPPTHVQGTFGPTYAAEYLGIPVSATVLSINTSDRMAAVWSTASAKLLRRSATSELRALSSLVPSHARLARTYGNESISTQGSLRIVHHKSGDGGGEPDEEDGPAALVLVGEMVEGGSLRDRIKECGAAAEAATGEETADVLEVDGEVGVEGKLSAKGGEGEEEARADSSGELPAAPLLQRRKVLADIAEGLACLHERGVSHGALSSENVLLDAEGRAKVRRRRTRGFIFTGPPFGLMAQLVGCIDCI